VRGELDVGDKRQGGVEELYYGSMNICDIVSHFCSDVDPMLHLSVRGVGCGFYQGQMVGWVDGRRVTILS
jgi:hypothetical protein